MGELLCSWSNPGLPTQLCYINAGLTKSVINPNDTFQLISIYSKCAMLLCWMQTCDLRQGQC